MKKKFKRDSILLNDIKIKVNNDIFNAEMTEKEKAEYRKNMRLKMRWQDIGDVFFKGQTYVFKGGLSEHRYKIISKRYYKKRKKVYLILEPMWI